MDIACVCFPNITLSFPLANSNYFELLPKSIPKTSYGYNTHKYWKRTATKACTRSHKEPVLLHNALFGIDMKLGATWSDMKCMKWQRGCFCSHFYSTPWSAFWCVISRDFKLHFHCQNNRYWTLNISQMKRD